MKKNWIIDSKVSSDLQNKFPELDPIVLQLLANRGINTQEKVDEFLNPDYGEDLHNPFLFLEMEKAVKRIFEAIEKKEKILIWGDYDADGVSGAALLYLSLKDMGAEVEVYLPDRELEGYGLKEEALDRLAKKGIKLVVTVDCGISNVEQVKLAKELGMEVIITDHHEEPEKLPKAYAIINAKLSKEKYPFRDLAGVGVAFKVIQALSKMFEKGDTHFEKWLLDLVALGTVSDLMPLLGENRTLVKYGLVVLNKTRRKGLKELIKISRSNRIIETDYISFQLGPRLNAASRIDHANTAFELLITESQEEAETIAKKLNRINYERQLMVEKIMQEVKPQVEAQKKEKLLIVETPKNWNWPVGIIGLIAGRISDNQNKPVIVITGSKKGHIQGSARSIHGLDINSAIGKCSKYLINHGGHMEASGFGLHQKNLTYFKSKLKAVVEKELKEIDYLTPVVEIDAKLKLEEANFNLYEDLEKFEPYGKANKRPKFLCTNLQVVGLERLGNNEQHLKILALQNNFHPKKFIGFGFGKEIGLKLKIGDIVDIVFELGINEWNGNRELQMKIVDIDITNI